MKKIIFKGHEGKAYERFYYVVNDEGLTLYEENYLRNPRYLFHGKSKHQYILDKKAKDKLFSLLTEDEIKERFGEYAGYLKFIDFLSKNKIEYTTIMTFD